MIDGGFGGIEEMSLEMKEWTALSEHEPFKTKKQAQQFIDFYNSTLYKEDKWSEATIVENNGGFYIYYR